MSGMWEFMVGWAVESTRVHRQAAAPKPVHTTQKHMAIPETYEELVARIERKAGKPDVPFFTSIGTDVHAKIEKTDILLNRIMQSIEDEDGFAYHGFQVKTYILPRFKDSLQAIVPDVETDRKFVFFNLKPTTDTLEFKRSFYEGGQRKANLFERKCQCDNNEEKFMVECAICFKWFHGLCAIDKFESKKHVDDWEQRNGVEWRCCDCDFTNHSVYREGMDLEVEIIKRPACHHV
jgi:hypothetical protein